MPKPVLIIVAGCNGSGKSTFSKNLVKPDIIPFDYDKLLLKNLESLPDSELKEDFAKNQTTEDFKNSITKAFANGEDFCYETNFDSQPYPMYWAEKAKLLGYLLVLHFFCIESIDLANERVKNRAKDNGHFVPTETVFHKWKEGYKNLNLHYLFFDHIIIFDNTSNNSFPIPLLSLTRTNKELVVKKFIETLPEYSDRRFPAIYKQITGTIRLNEAKGRGKP